MADTLVTSEPQEDRAVEVEDVPDGSVCSKVLRHGSVGWAVIWRYLYIQTCTWDD